METLGRPYSSINRITSPNFTPVLQVQQTGNFVVHLYINAHQLSIQLDTWSQITILNRNDWSNTGSSSLSPVSVCTQSYSGDPLLFSGKVFTKVQFEDCVVSTIVRISRTSVISILGRDLIFLLRLDSVPIKSFCHAIFEDSALQKLLSPFASVFQPGLGFCSQEKAQWQLKPDSSPIFKLKRPVLQALKHWKKGYSAW